MREIKFRAWDDENEEMVYEVGVTPEGIPYTIPDHNESFDTFNYYPHCHKMQYTGLKDKDGREIWEGDILDYKWKASTRDLLVVEWSKKDACFLMGGVRTDYAIAYGEVIGNIYEHSHLLEVPE